MPLVLQPTILATQEAVSAGPSPVGEQANRFYRPELDVLRFIAFLLVFLTHTLPSGIGRDTVDLPHFLAEVIYVVQRTSVYGLSLFFTLSAYLICELLLREREATGTVLAGKFYFRRALRIWPLYFAGLAVGLLIALVHDHRSNTFMWTAWATVLLGNWYVIFRGLPGNLMFPLWSISVEEQFYAIAPWTIKLLDRRTLIAFAIVLAILANIWLFTLGAQGGPDYLGWYSSWVQFENFAAGILLCIFLHGRLFNLHAWQRTGAIALSILCWYSAAGILHVHSDGPFAPTKSWPSMTGYGLIAFGCVFLLFAFLGVDNRTLPSSLIYLGRISYGLYVFHSLAIHLVGKLWSTHPLGGWALLRNLVVAFGLTVVMAAVSYRYFETPFLKLKKRYELIQSRPV